MNTQEIISSGKLELYVAGALSDREMSEIAAYALENPEVALEIERIERAMVDFLGNADFNFSTDEKEGQLQLLLQRFQSGQSSPARSTHRIFQIGQKAVAAIVVGLIAIACLGVWAGVKVMNMQHEVATVHEKDERLMAENAAYKDRVNVMEQQAALMQNIITRRVELTSVKGNAIAPNGSYMLVYWNPDSQKLLLVDAKLPELPVDQQYQLWALFDNQPVDAGVVDFRDQQVCVRFQKDVAHAQAFAVTVEPKGGSAVPTMSKLCMLGKL